MLIPRSVSNGYLLDKVSPMNKFGECQKRRETFPFIGCNLSVSRARGGVVTECGFAVVNERGLMVWLAGNMRALKQVAFPISSHRGIPRYCIGR